MTVSLDLPADALARLRAEASRRGVEIDVIVAELASQLPGEKARTEHRSLAFIGAGASAHGISDRIDDLLADGFGRD